MQWPDFVNNCVNGHTKKHLHLESLGAYYLVIRVRRMSDEWIKTLADRRRVKFTSQELDESAFLTAQVEGNKVVHSIVLSNATSPLSREEVENHFEDELSKVSSNSKGPSS